MTDEEKAAPEVEDRLRDLEESTTGHGKRIEDLAEQIEEAREQLRAAASVTARHEDRLTDAEKKLVSIASAVASNDARIEEVKKITLNVREIALKAQRATEEALHIMSVTTTAMTRASADTEQRIKSRIEYAVKEMSAGVQTAVKDDIAKSQKAINDKLSFQDDVLLAIKEANDARVRHAESRDQSEREKAKFRLLALGGSMVLLVVLVALKVVARAEIDDKYIFGAPVIMGAIAMQLINATGGTRRRDRDDSASSKKDD